MLLQFKKVKVFIVGSVMAIAATSCAVEKDSFSIKGSAAGIPDQKIYLKEVGDDSMYRPLKEGVIVNGKFEFEGVINNPPRSLVIQFEDREIFSRDSFYADHSDMIVTMTEGVSRGRKGMVANVEGSKYFDLARDFEAKVTVFNEPIREKIKAIRSLNLDMKLPENELSAEDLAEHKSLVLAKSKLENDYAVYLKGLVGGNGENFTRMLAMYNLDLGLAGSNPFSSEQEREVLYSRLDKKLQASGVGLVMKVWSDRTRKESRLQSELATGGQFKDFTQKDVSGKPITVSDLLAPNRILFVDFWASWCAPCRAENPHVLEAYNNYHKKGLDILAVSLDEDRGNWLEAIKEDGMPWPQVSDLKGFENAAAKLYGIEAIPMNILIDGKGEILASGLKGKALQAKVAEFLSK